MTNESLQEGERGAATLVHEPPVADDILRGAEEIAAFLLGDRQERRRIYELAEMRLLPVFRMGRIICARRSTLSNWIAQQEVRGRAPDGWIV